MGRYICTSDWHLSGTRPLMRTDADWIETQRRHLSEIYRCAMENDATVLVAGDVFDVPTVPPVILNMVLGFLLRWPKTYFIAGNHDLPYHSLERMEQCSFGAVRKVNPIPDGILHGDFGLDKVDGDGEVVMHHHFSVELSSDIPPMRDALTAQQWLDAYPDGVRLIVVGDNHIPWVHEQNGRYVVNCGCLIQRTATEAMRGCGFYYMDTDAGVCERHDLSELSRDCIDLTYLERMHERDEATANYEGLVSELKGSVGKSYDFPSTLEEYTKMNSEALGEDVCEFLDSVVEYIKGE